MNPRARRILLLSIAVLLIAGLLIAGPVHHVLHIGPHGTYCDGCAISGTAPPPSPGLGSRFDLAQAPPSERPALILASIPLVAHSPRGPPAPA